MRYNFKKQIGEVKIDKEYSQRCPVHRGPPVHAMVGDMGGSKWVMQKVMRFIRARFYLDQKSGNQNRRNRSDVSCSGSSSSSQSGSGTSLDRMGRAADSRSSSSSSSSSLTSLTWSLQEEEASTAVQASARPRSSELRGLHAETLPQTREVSCH